AGLAPGGDHRMGGGAEPPADPGRSARHAEPDRAAAAPRALHNGRPLPRDGGRGHNHASGLLRRDDPRAEGVGPGLFVGRLHHDDARTRRLVGGGRIAHVSRSPIRYSSARSRLMWAMPSIGSTSIAGGSNTGMLRNGWPQAPARGGRIGTLPTKNFALVLLPTGRPTPTCPRCPSISCVSSSVEITEAIAATSIAALALRTSDAGSAAMLRSRAARWSRCTSGTWSPFVAP